MEVNQWSLKRWLLAGFQLVIILLILFGKWLGYDVPFIGEDSTTLLKVGKLMTNLAEEFGSDAGSGLSAIAILIYLLLVVGFIMTWQTVSNLFSSRTISIGGYLFGVILFVCMLLLVALSNASISSETDGWLDDIFKLGSASYWTLALSIAGWIVCEKMPVPRTDPPAPPAPAPVHKDKHCIKCGRLEKNTASRFCSVCGGALVEELHCPKCHRLLDWNMRYCPECGIDVYQYKAESDTDKPTEPAMPVCRYCGVPAKKATATFCYQCGKPLAAPERKCASCGCKLEEDDLFCPNCGAKPDNEKTMRFDFDSKPKSDSKPNVLRQGGDL